VGGRGVAWRAGVDHEDLTAGAGQDQCCGQAGGASADGEVADQPVDEFRAALDVDEFVDGHTARCRSLLQDLLVDQPIAQAVGNRLTDDLAAGTDQS